MREKRSSGNQINNHEDLTTAVSENLCTESKGNLKLWHSSDVTLTNRDAAVGAAEVDVALWDGSHAQLVKGSSKEGGEGTGEHDITIPCGTTNGNAYLQERTNILIKRGEM